MKNKDKRNIDMNIQYCDKIELIMDEYDNDYLLFQESDSFQLATAMCILQIGEYIGRLSEDFKLNNSNIDWKKFKGMRDFVTHQYERVENYFIWTTLSEDIPKLKNDLYSIK